MGRIARFRAFSNHSITLVSPRVVSHNVNARFASLPDTVSSDSYLGYVMC